MTMLSINTNVGALKAASASYSVNKSMDTSMQRLSTGKRINTAADDAAGVQIANRMTAEIQGLNMAIRNAADGQALLATAEGAMQEIHNILLRMRELAVQASNGTTSAADKLALQSEVAALELEITRIATDTTWAGIALLDGTQTNGITFQIGADSGQTVTHSLTEMTAAGAGVAVNANSGVTTPTDAMSYITNVDAAISRVGAEREQVGAVMNRLDHTIANLENVATNLALAKGRIEDADFAKESANLARTQVLQQASMAMLAQANASKQNILTLFQ
jgi:flagellin